MPRIVLNCDCLQKGICNQQVRVRVPLHTPVKSMFSIVDNPGVFSNTLDHAANVVQLQARSACPRQIANVQYRHTPEGRDFANQSKGNTQPGSTSTQGFLSLST